MLDHTGFFKRALMIGFFITLIAISTNAQTAQTVTVGDSVIADLTVSNPQLSFRVPVTQGETVEIEVIALPDDLALQVVVLDTAGQVLQTLDNPDADPVLIAQITAEADEDLTVQVRATDGGSGPIVVGVYGVSGSVCAEIVESTLQAVSVVCEGTARNQACVGSTTVQAQSALPTGIDFDDPGDIEAVDAIDRISMSALDTEGGELGVVLMRVEADLPETLPGAAVNLLLFGGLQVENRVAMDPTLADSFTSMQAFYFQPGIGTASCAEVPSSGVVIETPQGVGQVTFNINDVEVSLGSTALFTFDGAADERALNIRVLQGEARVRSGDIVRELRMNQELSVQVDGNFRATGTLSDVRETLQDAPLLRLGLIRRLRQRTDGFTSQDQAAGDDQTDFSFIDPSQDGRPALPIAGPCVLRSNRADFRPTVYQETRITSAVVGELEPGVLYPVVGRNGAGTWFRLRNGWVPALAVETGGECAALAIVISTPSGVGGGRVPPIPPPPDESGRPGD